MADEPKPQSPEPAPASEPQSDAASMSPAPTEFAGKPEGEAGTNTNEAGPKPPTSVQAEPLSDGTVPTVLTPGQTHKSVPKGRASITSIYRRADILTTLITFVVALAAGALIVGGYVYFNRPKAAVTKPPTKVTSLDSADLAKLGAFFQGNSAGTSTELLTISSSSLFKSRVAVSSDLKVTGSLEVSGPSNLADLTVNKTSTLGITNIHGQLIVSGPANFQSPAQFGAGGAISGNLTVTGNGSYGGSISAGSLNAATISVTTINLSGHLSITGPSPTVAGTGLGGSATIEGNDSSGTVTVTVGPCTSGQCVSAGGQLVIVNFHSAYPRTPHIMISPIGAPAARLEPYIQPGASSFTIGAATINNSTTTSYSFAYWVVQ